MQDFGRTFTALTNKVRESSMDPVAQLTLRQIYNLTSGVTSLNPNLVIHLVEIGDKIISKAILSLPLI